LKVFKTDKDYMMKTLHRWNLRKKNFFFCEFGWKIQNIFNYFSFGISNHRIEEFCRNLEVIQHPIEELLHPFEDKWHRVEDVVRCVEALLHHVEDVLHYVEDMLRHVEDVLRRRSIASTFRFYPPSKVFDRSKGDNW